MPKTLLRVALFLAYTGLLGTTFVAAGYFSFNGFVGRGSVPAPDLIGLPVVEAVSALARLGLRGRHHEGEDRFDELVPAGAVLQQDPPAGILVKRRGTVVIVVSRGRHVVKVPLVDGKAVQAAMAEIGAAGLTPGRRGLVYWPRTQPGEVVYQYPRAGTETDPAVSISLLVAAQDPVAYVMPDLVNRRADAVRVFFEQRGLRIGSVKYEPYEGVEDGVILRHTPQAGSPLHRQDAITLVVSTAAFAPPPLR